MKAYLKNYRQSPRKVRLVADLIKGKGVDESLIILEHTAKKATRELSKLIESAVANAKENDGREKEDLVIKNVIVNEGPTLKRVEYRARGGVNVLNKRTSHISVILADKDAEKELVKRISKAKAPIGEKSEKKEKRSGAGVQNKKAKQKLKGGKPKPGKITKTAKAEAPPRQAAKS